jgi:hypothetical protein
MLAVLSRAKSTIKLNTAMSDTDARIRGDAARKETEQHHVKGGADIDRK